MNEFIAKDTCRRCGTVYELEHCEESHPPCNCDGKWVTSPCECGFCNGF